jgi:hypothetical protein
MMEVAGNFATGHKGSLSAVEIRLLISKHLHRIDVSRIKADSTILRATAIQRSWNVDAPI